MASFDRLTRALKRFQFHSLDVNFDEVDTRKVEFIQCYFSNLDGSFRRIVNRLTDEFVAIALSQLKTAETRCSQIIGVRDLQGAGLRGNGGVQGSSVEAIVDRNISGQGVVNTFLRLNCYYGTPAGHRSCPLNRMDA